MHKVEVSLVKSPIEFNEIMKLGIVPRVGDIINIAGVPENSSYVRKVVLFDLSLASEFAPEAFVIIGPRRITTTGSLYVGDDD